MSTPQAPLRPGSGSREALAERCRRLARQFDAFPAIAALRASPEGRAVAEEIDGILSDVWRYDRSPDGPEPSAPRGPLKVVHWNIEHGNWYEQVQAALAGNADMRGADLVMLNEVDLGCARSANRDVTHDLAVALDMYGAWAPMFLESTLGRDDDVSTAGDLRNQEGFFGISVLSRWPIASTRLVSLPGPEAIQFDLERMYGRFVALTARIERPGAPFLAVSVHLEVHRTRRHRTEQMQVLMRALEGETLPIVLAGDFNSHTFDRGLWHSPLRGANALLLQPNVRRRLLHPDEGPSSEGLFAELARHGFDWKQYTDYGPTLQVRMERLDEAMRVLRPLGPLARTITAWAERRAQLRLDWFAGRGWNGGGGRTVHGLDGPGRASDHAPIVAEFE